jgi:hypothetical protein
MLSLSMVRGTIRYSFAEAARKDEIGQRRRLFPAYKIIRE